jgi:hypothetical protein
MNANEHAAGHAEASRRTTESWHRHAAVPTLNAQAAARATEAAGKSDALRRSADYRRSLPVNGDAT